jgi:hypothetical protein
MAATAHGPGGKKPRMGVFAPRSQVQAFARFPLSEIAVQQYLQVSAGLAMLGEGACRSPQLSEDLRNLHQQPDRMT